MPPQTPQPSPIGRPRLLIGEGQDEVFFFQAFLAHLGRNDVQVEQFRGKTNLSPFIHWLKNRAGYPTLLTLAVTRDADVSVASAFQSISTALSNHGLAVPPAPGQFAAGAPRVGVFVVPDNAAPGMLEDLCLSAVQTDPVMPCVNDYFQCVQNQANRLPNPMAKARVHAWLSSHLEPDLRLGEAAKKNIWPWASPAFDALRQFPQNL
jgi:hypothetical protein